MADLDDFFAKKDKKKKGKGKKFTSKTPQTLAEHTVQTPEEDSSASKDTKIDIPNVQSKDEEWIEEAEVVEDFEGLKIAPLRQESSGETSKSAPPTERTEETEGEKGVNTDKNLSKQVASPWQNVQADDSEGSEEEEEEPEAEKPAHPADALVSQGKYIPPSMRNQATPTLGGSSRSRFKKTAPPDIQSAQVFPSLQASLSATNTQTDKDFTEVKGSKKGARSVDSTFSVELTNKFSSLS